jgi:hypothetical protein
LLLLSNAFVARTSHLVRCGITWHRAVSALETSSLHGFGIAGHHSAMFYTVQAAFFHTSSRSVMEQLEHLEDLIKNAVIQAGHEVTQTVDKWKLDIELRIVDIAAQKAADLTVQLLANILQVPAVGSEGSVSPEPVDEDREALEAEFVKQWRFRVRERLGALGLPAPPG